MGGMILIIDNYDSFTYNLYQQIIAFDFEVQVAPHDKITISKIKEINPEKIVISPGPGRPENAGISNKVVETMHKTTPILGVCLGHQCIAEVFGSKIDYAKEVMHGKTSEINHVGKGLFTGISNPFFAARYHSLIIDSIPDGFEKTAWTDSGEIMAIEHKKYPVYGIQFHPESFMTQEGAKIVKNFLFDYDPD